MLDIFNAAKTQLFPTFWRDHKTSAFSCSSINHLHYVYKLLLVIHCPVDLQPTQASWLKDCTSTGSIVTMSPEQHSFTPLLLSMPTQQRHADEAVAHAHLIVVTCAQVNHDVLQHVHHKSAEDFPWMLTAAYSI